MNYKIELLVTLSLLIFGRVNGQYTWTYQDYPSSLLQVTNIHSFGSKFLVKRQEYTPNPIRVRQPTYILSPENNYLEGGSDFADSSTRGFRISRQLVVNSNAAVITTSGDLSTEVSGTLMTVIDSLGIVIASSSLEESSQFGLNLLPDTDSTFINFRQVFPAPDSVAFVRINLELEVIDTMFFTAPEGSVSINAIGRSTEGSYLICYENRIGNNPTFEVISLDTSGAIISTKQVDYPYGIEGYTDLEFYGNDGFALLNGYDNDSELGCVVEACPGFGDVVGSLSIFLNQESPREFYELKFYPFGLVKDADGEIIVYGTTLEQWEQQRAVLFKPAGWPDGSRTIVLEPNVDGIALDQGATSLRRLRLTERGTFIGAGEQVIEGGENPQEWYFELDVNTCLSNNCDLITVREGELVSAEPPASELSTVTAYPNPFTSEITFSHKVFPGNSEQLRYAILSTVGQPLLEGRMSSPAHRTNLEGLPPGVYVLIIYEGGVPVATQRIVKI